MQEGKRRKRKHLERARGGKMRRKDAMVEEKADQLVIRSPTPICCPKKKEQKRKEKLILKIKPERELSAADRGRSN